jgi:hypothetical protein
MRVLAASILATVVLLVSAAPALADPCTEFTCSGG